MSYEDLVAYYAYALDHKKNHRCTAVPYDNGSKLVELVKGNQFRHILEVGTGIGYSTACLAFGNKNTIIHTIDKNEEHLSLAGSYWRKLGLKDTILSYHGKVEDILPSLPQSFDFIFYDGHVPQKKLVNQFYVKLVKSGTLVTANLFLVDPKGGSYLRQLKDTKTWNTDIFSDTAVSVKI